MIQDGIEVIVWDDNMKIEQRILSDLPDEYLHKVIELAIALKSEQSIYDTINAKLSVSPDLTKDNIESYPDLAIVKTVIPEIASE